MYLLPIGHSRTPFRRVTLPSLAESYNAICAGPKRCDCHIVQFSSLSIVCYGRLNKTVIMLLQFPGSDHPNLQESTTPLA